jgi:Ca2+-binding RTX toxin-like protein
MLDGNPADIDLIASTSTTAFGGADTINSGDGNDIVIGGRGADTVIAGEGDNIVIGDSGSITAASVDAPQRAGLPITVSVIETVAFAEGGGDTITTGDGNNIVMGGFGNDTITTGLGADIVLGDDARIDTMLDGNPADIDLIASTSTTAFGGADTINSGAGNDIVIGGRGADTVIAGEGDNILIGDCGSITAASVDAPQRAGLPITVGVIETIAFAEGGNDTITTGDGNNIVMGGFGNDTITTGLGADIVMGDDARIDTMLDGNPADIDLIISTSTTAFGGADTINSGAGNDIVIGGRGDDTVIAGDGNNIVIGDSGSITAASTDSPQLAGLPITIETVQAITVADGGNDSITTGSGNDLVIAGFGNDVVSTGDGNDVVLGDSGVIVVDALGALVSIATGDPVLGGNDVIDTGAGNDVAMGGAGNDTVLGGAGNDILFGDGGQVTYSPDGKTVDILSLDTTLGGSDIVDGGLGNDVLIGGQGVDNIYGTLSSDLIFGNNAAVRLLSGLVVRMEADVHDLVTATMFGMFDALPDRLEVAAVAFQDLWLVFALGEDGKVERLQGDDLLDITVFENIFALSIHGRTQGIEGSDVFQNLFQLGSAVAPGEQHHSGSMEPQEGDAPASVPVTPQPVEQAVPATSYQPEIAPALVQSAGQGTEPQRNVQSDVLATLLGITGLQLNDGQRRRCRTLLRVAARKWHALLRRGWV